MNAAAGSGHEDTQGRCSEDRRAAAVSDSRRSLAGETCRVVAQPRRRQRAAAGSVLVLGVGARALADRPRGLCGLRPERGRVPRRNRGGAEDQGHSRDDRLRRARRLRRAVRRRARGRSQDVGDGSMTPATDKDYRDGYRDTGPIARKSAPKAGDATVAGKAAPKAGDMSRPVRKEIRKEIRKESSGFLRYGAVLVVLLVIAGGVAFFFLRGDCLLYTSRCV